MSALCQTPPYTPSGFLPPQDCWKTYAFDELLDDSSNCRVILWELIHQIRWQVHISFDIFGLQWSTRDCGTINVEYHGITAVNVVKGGGLVIA
jgi:hypothetical protein